MVILTFYLVLLFSSISCRYFSKWRLKMFRSGNQPPTPELLTAYPTLTFRDTSEYFSSKWPQKMNLKLLKCLGSVSFASYATKSLNTPFGRWKLEETITCIWSLHTCYRLMDLHRMLPPSTIHIFFCSFVVQCHANGTYMICWRIYLLVHHRLCRSIWCPEKLRG